MLRVLLSCAVLSAPAALRAQGPAEGLRDVRVTQVQGTVTLFAADDPEGVPAEVDMPLEPGDRIVTGAGSTAELAFDSGESVVTIDESSDFTLRSAQRSQTVLDLASGGLLAKIKKLLEGETLRVQAPAAVAAVRGTEFGVEASEGGQTHVGVFDEGRVEVSGQSGPPQVLEPNQETSVVKGAPAQPPRRLERFVRRRELMRKEVRARASRLRRAWKTLPPERRRELRRKALDRMRQRIRQRRGQRFEKAKDRREERRGRRRQRRQERR